MYLENKVLDLYFSGAVAESGCEQEKIGSLGMWGLRARSRHLRLLLSLHENV